jgi:hypothetical protein
MAFVLSFERLHRVVKATAVGVIATQDLLDLDLQLIAFLANEERAGGPPIRAVFDFTDVAALAVPETMAVQRASQPAVVRGQRVIVQSNTASCGLVQTLVQSQVSAGASQFAVVDSLDEAHAFLGMDAQQYEDILLGGA